ncbi:RluA family pseudouridine synthase [Candidatus Parcubacteria bacterium]|jgi:23S rRNA pseudouridine1911/1915/1917 synthase|nr:RluA family pseudouridine synthase [Candidatus Parcubacteria bacterium]
MEYTYQEQDKERLDKFLLNHLDISRSQIKKVILDGQVTVNGKVSTVHHWLKHGDKILYEQKVVVQEPATFDTEPKIIRQVDEYLILEKPHGLLVHPTDKGENDTLADWLVKYFPETAKIGDDPNRPAIVHRLDKEVSGLMIIPLTQDSFDNLKRQFQDRTIKKEYTALVHGQMINEQGEITTPLERDKKTGLMKVQSAKNSGKRSHTTYQVIKKFIKYTLVEVQLKTGRMHQIRAHLYSIGHSIVGDKLYRTKDLRKKKKVLEQRIFLHANFLKFRVLDGQYHTYHSELPKELKDFLKTIK